MVGGQRVSTRRRNNNESSGPRSNLPPNSGFQKYYGLTTTGLEMDQQSVLLLALIYMGVVVVMHIVSRINLVYKG
ncbi:protein-transport (SEC61), beta subunit [Theileria annulata]|uniref:Protein-transport (SEC61 homologue), beta subunit, putative n=1 Tax=Theileria annulata TaxID=5874 RepID=Q4UI84_THEAN|nr:protein-transport (SEC61), beta subunit [Theileria annulata]CAI73205.1 protein-transport (SEC61 homologue), beta subunit, putative [Theileria annulata]|eukprot:XP_953883.1 protein-transport (SEC61 homologue), beta subunit, putative [Theileria annulata]